MQTPFKTTSCSCREDRENCLTQPGHILPGQLETIMTHLGKTISDAGKYFWNSPGMVLGSTTGRIFRVRTITPRFENGKCVFYESGRCTIHSVAPFGCRYFDVHMKGKETQKRSLWGARFILDRLAEYSKQRDQLDEATHYSPRSAL